MSKTVSPQTKEVSVEVAVLSSDKREMSRGK